MVNAPASLNSCSTLLSLLSEPDPSLTLYSLTQLNLIIPQFWFEISENLSNIELIFESSKSEEEKSLAALILSKVFWYLGEEQESLKFAIESGEKFLSVVKGGEGDEKEYKDGVLAACLDSYIKQRVSSSNPPKPDPRLLNIVEMMFSKCLQDKEWKQAIGLSLDSRRLDVLEKTIKSASKDASLNLEELLGYVLEGVLGSEGSSGSGEGEFREGVLQLLLTLLPPTSTHHLTQIFILLNSPSRTVSLLLTLLSQSKSLKTSNPEESARQKLLAYQVAFDLVEDGGLGLRLKVLKELEEKEEEGLDVVRRILGGKETIKLNLEFLFRNNKGDAVILKNIKESLESRSSVYHSALSFSNAFSNAGTTSDQFLRDNLDWLAKASNWSKFTATAALGVIHRGNLDNGMNILGPYLPSAGSGGPGGPGASVYSEGGSLYGLGLINANHFEKDLVEFLKKNLRENSNEVIQHGACLGLGISTMASQDLDIYEELKTVLFNDNAVAGEAAGYAIGLVMLGSGAGEEGKRVGEEMLQYARETQHEKIIRGLSVGMAFLYFGLREGADDIVKTLMEEKDPILRYGAIFTLALAYAGTGNNRAIQQVLRVAVTDVNDDVRRAAVIALGFILFRTPQQVPRVVQLLSESYNPHVRYGSTLALGIACAGTGSEEAIEILEPMTKDPVDYVRQGACIALSMILIQRNPSHPKYNSTRKIFEKILSDKHEDAMAKFGAAISQGLIDAGGRNVTISLASKSGSLNMMGIAGMVLFTQFWYWFPLAHSASLSFVPTAIIGLNEKLEIPKFEFTSNAKPSMFAYPPETKPPTKETVEKVKTAVLSTTAKAQARKKEKEKAKEEGMDIDIKPSRSNTMEIDAEEKKEKDDKKEEEKKEEPEPSSEKLSNLSRVVPAQLPYISFSSVDESGRFFPVRPILSSFSSAAPASSISEKEKKKKTHRLVNGGGILMMLDKKPGEKLEIIQMEVTKSLEDTTPVVPSTSEGDDVTSDPIAEPPQSFEYEFDD